MQTERDTPKAQDGTTDSQRQVCRDLEHEAGWFAFNHFET